MAKARNLSGDAAPTAQEIEPFVTVAINNGRTEAEGLQDCTDFYLDDVRQKITSVDGDVADYNSFIRDQEFYYLDGIDLSTTKGLFPFMVGDGSMAARTLTRHNNLVNGRESDDVLVSRWKTGKRPQPSVSGDGLNVETKNTPTAEVVSQIVADLPTTDPIGGNGGNPKQIYREAIRLSGDGWAYKDTTLQTVTAEWNRQEQEDADTALEQSKGAMNADYMGTVYNPAVSDPSVTLDELRIASVDFYNNYTPPA